MIDLITGQVYNEHYTGRFSHNCRSRVAIFGHNSWCRTTYPLHKHTGSLDRGQPYWTIVQRTVPASIRPLITGVDHPQRHRDANVDGITNTHSDHTQPCVHYLLPWRCMTHKQSSATATQMSNMSQHSKHTNDDSAFRQRHLNAGVNLTEM